MSRGLVDYRITLYLCYTSKLQEAETSSAVWGSKSGPVKTVPTGLFAPPLPYILYMTCNFIFPTFVPAATDLTIHNML